MVKVVHARGAQEVLNNMSESVQSSSGRSVAKVSGSRKEITKTARTFALVINIVSSLLVSGSYGCPHWQRLVDVAFVGGIDIGDCQLGWLIRGDMGGRCRGIVRSRG